MSESKIVDPPLTATTRDKAMTVLRQYGVTDDIIGKALGLSRQRVHARLGPRPAFKRAVNAPRPDARLDDLPGYIKDWRERNGLSIAGAARIAGTNTISWWSWETNRTGCSMPGLLLRYLALLDEHPDRIKRNNFDKSIDNDV
jgi:hypothetical protein